MDQTLRVCQSDRLSASNTHVADPDQAAKTSHTGHGESGTRTLLWIPISIRMTAAINADKTPVRYGAAPCENSVIRWWVIVPHPEPNSGHVTENCGTDRRA